MERGEPAGGLGGKHGPGGVPVGLGRGQRPRCPPVPAGSVPVPQPRGQRSPERRGRNCSGGALGTRDTRQATRDPRHRHRASPHSGPAAAAVSPVSQSRGAGTGGCHLPLCPLPAVVATPPGVPAVRCDPGRRGRGSERVKRGCDAAPSPPTGGPQELSAAPVSRLSRLSRLWPCGGVAAMAGLLPALVAVSQKAAEVARLCRAEEPLFGLLVAEKTGPERSARFARDFKTLADVLIQEVIKHDLGTQFPELRGHIHGEESSEFRDAQGGTVTVRVCATPGDTVALLLAVLGPEQTRAAELLAEAVHKEVTLGDTELDGIDPGVSPGDLGIWIDPIDSTNEFIGGREDVPTVDGIAPGGLRSALVLVGAFDRHSGVPVLGVINEPFFQRDPQTHRWQGRYHWGVAHGDIRLCSLSPPVPRPCPRVVLSRAEGAAVRGALASLGGGPPLFAAGAGYKLLCVALGLADAFVLSQATTFAWDSCAPHAILRALGGGVVALGGALRARREGGTGDPPELRYHRPEPGRAGPERWANREGLVAFVHPPHLRAVLGALGGLGDIGGLGGTGDSGDIGSTGGVGGDGDSGGVGGTGDSGDSGELGGTGGVGGTGGLGDMGGNGDMGGSGDMGGVGRL